MALVEEKVFCGILGTVVEVKQMSAKAKLLRKTYMGVWRRGAEIIRIMMTELPEMLIGQTQAEKDKRDLLFLVGRNAQKNKMGHTGQVIVYPIYYH